MSARNTILKLYRNVLRAHRQNLPPPMRAVGDRYAKDEFRKHKEGETSETQWREFISEWQKYVNSINGTSGSTPGEIPLETLETLTPEQKVQLERLKAETLRFSGTVFKERNKLNYKIT
mmetsp:Transcript_30514/g.42254  ORF Transcript_30514/g.42254 Transcript_30514/m.42254 type:complete len:119 (+) Transcript_30514:290-646(+)